jgi:VWFA-related protein
VSGRLRLAALVAIVGLATGMAGPAARARAARVQTAQLTVRSGVDLVEVAALVRDGDGRLVSDLTAADFQILDGGTPQVIAAFQRVALPMRESAARTAPVAHDVAHDVASNEGIGDARVFVLVLDALHVAASRTRAVRAHARQFIEQHVGPADLVAVVSPGALTSATQDFTRDRARLLAAVDQFAGTKLTSAAVEIEQEKRVLEVPLHRGMDPSDGERANRVRSLSDVLAALASHLDRVESRRKSLLLFSEGVDYDTMDIMGKLQRESSDVMKAMNRAVGALMRANVSMYAIDPRALGSAEGDLLEHPVHAPTRSLTQSSVDAEYSDSIRTLRDMSGATGGFAAVNRNDIGPAFERIIEESSEYYVLGYTPSKPAKRGEFRAIDVRVSRPGVRVVARKGYLVPAAASRTFANDAAVDTAQPANMPGRPRTGRLEIPATETVARPPAGVPAELNLLLASPLPRAGLPIRVQAVVFRGSSRKAAVRLVVEVLGRTLAFAERGGKFEERIDLALLTVDDRARAANGRSVRIDVRLMPDELARVKATGVRWLAQLDLEPGHYQLRVAGRALGTGTSGTVAYDIDVPVFEPERLAVSGVTMTSLPSVLMLTRGDTWLQTTIETPPSAARSFVAGDLITAAVEVYVPGATPGDVSIAAELESPGGSRTTTARKSIARGSGKGRVEAAAFPIETSRLAPGRHVLHIVLDPSGTAPVVRRVPFEIVAKS